MYNLIFHVQYLQSSVYMKSSNTDLRSQDGVTLKVYIHNLRHKRASALQAEICNFKITLSYKFVHILFVHFRSKDGFFFSFCYLKDQ